MLRARVELTVYADNEGAIDPSRVTELVDQGASLGYGSPIEYVEPTDGRPWGLRIVGIDEDDQEMHQ